MATTEQRVSTLEIQFSALMAKVDAMAEESKQQREDIRRLHERQDAAQAKHDAEIKAAQEKHDADIKEMNQRFYAKFDVIDAKMDALNKQIHDTWKQTMIGVGGMIIGLGALIIAALK